MASPEQDVVQLVAELQAELRTTRERLTLLSQASFEGILVHIDGVVIEANARLAEILRCSVEELLGPRTMPRCVAPEDLPEVLARLRDGYEGAYTITGVRYDGSRFRAELQSKQGKLGDRPVRIAAVRDVSEREHTQALLRESEQHLRDLALGAFDFMIVTQHGVIVEVGGRFEELMGFTGAEVLGRLPVSFVPEPHQATVATAVSENRPGAYESVVIDKWGREVPVEVVGARSIWNGEVARVAGFRDLRVRHRQETERRKLEEQLQRSQKLESLGVLAGGIAHDFNNLLVGVIGNASLLLTTLTNPADRDAASAVLAAGERAATLTRQMLAYAGRQDLVRREPLELGELFRELRTLLDATLSKKATLNIDPEPQSVVVGDRATLMQVMMNLLTNASDALEDAPGKIDVRVKHVQDPDARWSAALGAPIGPGKWLLVEVEDDGVGMDAATRGRAFEPFFSTKERGHGLGLAACLGIVKSHGGAVLLDSEPGRGSKFSVLLPAYQRSTAPPPSPRLPLESACHVLIIDDEDVVRAQLRRILERHGHTVSEARDGLSGLEAQRRSPAEVLIVDMTMPDIDGAEVVRRLRAEGSTVGIILSSGYLAQSEQLPPEAVQVFLPKPYGMRELLDALRKARGSTGQG